MSDKLRYFPGVAPHAPDVATDAQCAHIESRLRKSQPGLNTFAALHDAHALTTEPIPVFVDLFCESAWGYRFAAVAEVYRKMLER